MRIDGVVEDDVGTYTCRASNLEDSIDAHTTLKVLGILVILSFRFLRHLEFSVQLCKLKPSHHFVI